MPRPFLKFTNQTLLEKYMAVITAAMVKELRVKTDAPMMECKKALTEADGDMARAEEILRVKLGNKASKAAARIAAEGVVSIYIAEDGKLGSIFALAWLPKRTRPTSLLWALWKSTVKRWKPSARAWSVRSVKT